MMALDNRLPSFGWKMKTVQNATSTVGEIWIYDDIVAYESWWDEGGVTPKKFKEDLDALGEVGRINVYINSNGGDVFAGQAIHSQLARHKAEVWVYVDGLAASIASVIAAAGDKVIMAVNAEQMVHLPWTIAMGNAHDMRKLADDLEVITESLVSAYMKRFKGTREELMALLEAETWLPAARCVELGLADEIEEGKKVAASLRGAILTIDGKDMDLSRFRNRPNVEVVAELPTPTPIVKGEDEPITDERVAEAVNRIMNETTLTRHDAITVATVAMAVYDAGRVLSAENEGDLQTAYDLVGGVLSKVKKDDGDADDKVDPPVAALAEFKPDERIDALLTEVKSLRELVANSAAFSNAPAPMQNVEPVAPAGEVTPSPVKGEEHIAPRDEVLELEDAADEANIEVDEVKETLKAALDELKTDLKAQNDEWRLKNLGRVD